MNEKPERIDPNSDMVRQVDEVLRQNALILAMNHNLLRMIESPWMTMDEVERLGGTVRDK